MHNKPAYKTQTVRRRNNTSPTGLRRDEPTCRSTRRHATAPLRRRKAVETLAEVLTNAMRRAAGEKAREAIQQRGYLD